MRNRSPILVPVASDFAPQVEQPRSDSGFAFRVSPAKFALLILQRVKFNADRPAILIGMTGKRVGPEFFHSLFVIKSMSAQPEINLAPSLYGFPSVSGLVAVKTHMDGSPA